MVLAIILLGFVIYANSLGNGFLGDDEEQILNNTAVHSIGHIGAFFSGGTFNSGGSTDSGGVYYRPVMTVFFSLLYTLFGQQASVFHLIQILIHIANSLLVFLIFKRFFRKHTAFFLALIFLVHPINTEAVLYISDLQDVLFVFFGGLATYLLMRDKLSLPRQGFIFLLLLLSLLSKESGVAFIFVGLVYILMFARSRLLGYLGGTILTASVYLILRIVVAGIPFGLYQLSPIARISLVERLINMPSIVGYYLKTFIFPMHLAVDQNWINKGDIYHFFLPALLLILLAGASLKLGFKIWVSGRRETLSFIFFFAWMAIGFGLVLQVFPLDFTVADRWFYFPMIGLLGIVGSLLKFWRPKSESFAVLGLGFMATLIVIFSLRTFTRTFDWRNGLALFGHDLKYSRDSFDLENNYGNELLRAGDFEQAKVHFERSTQLAPYWWINWNNLGYVYFHNRDIGKAKDCFLKALAHSDYYLAYQNLSMLMFLYDDPKAAEAFTKLGLSKFPQNAALWFILALEEYTQGNRQDAIAAVRQSQSINPREQTARLSSVIEQGLPIDINQLRDSI